MSINMNDALANKIWDTIMNGASSISMLDTGISEWRTGARPANANAAATGTIVSSVTHVADASGAPTARGVSLNGTMEDTSADNDGTIGWVRFRDAADTYRIDATCGQQGPAIAITAAALVGGFAQFTAAAHGLANGDMVEIAGHSVTAYNTKWDGVFGVTTNTFQIPVNTAVGTGGTARKTFDVVIDNAALLATQDFKVLSMAFAIPL
jgi:hypothetical protein